MRKAVLDANLEPTVNHTINFQSGLTGTIILTSGEISIASRITINGPGASALAVSGNQASRVFNTSGLPVTISGLTIKDGKPSTGGGGGISNSGALTLNNLRLVGNQSVSGGGGIYNTGTLTVTYSTLSNNNAQSGIFGGGGIYNGAGTLTVTYSTLSDNATSGDGGGIHDSSGGATNLTNSTLSGNFAANGGGIYCFNKVNLTNSTVTGNSAVSAGGGISRSAGTLVLRNTLVAGNTAASGVEINGAYSTSSANNQFGQNGFSGVVGSTPLAAEIIPGPLSSVIGSLADNGGPTQTHAPVAGSPVLNAGSNSLIPVGVTTDQRGAGFPRIVGGTVDIGAVESASSGSNTFTLTVTTGGNGAVTSTPTGINCGTTCTANFTSGTSVTLTANPDKGNTLSSWGGACSGAGACTVTMDKAQTVTATFSQGFSLPVSSSQNGLAYPITGTLTEQLALLNAGPPLFNATTWKPIQRHRDLYDPTAAFVCSQEPNPLNRTYMSTYDFMNNVDEVTYDNCTSAFYRFTFTLPDGATPQCLTGVANVDDQGVVFLNGHPISGTMHNPGCNPSPSNGPTDPCYAQQDAGKDDAKDDQGRIILAWPRQDQFQTCDVTHFKTGENELVFAIAGDASYYEPTGLEFTATVTGTGTVSSALLTVTKAGTGSGTVTSSPAGIDCGSDCTESYAANTPVTLTATATTGSTFAGWSGACTNSTGTCSVTMSAAKSVTATFNTASASTFTVTTLNDSGAGSLRQAVLDANVNADADTIVFSPTVTGSITLTSGEMPITHPVTITGPGASVLKVSGNNASRIFNIASDASVVIEGLTLEKGQSADNGGAIYNSGSVTLNNSQLSSNKAAKSGGGLYNNGGMVTVSNSTVSGNVAVGDGDPPAGGGGIFNKYGTVIVSNSTFSGNSTQGNSSGGAIQSQRNTVGTVLMGSLTVINSTLSGNSAGFAGGGISNPDGILTIINSTVSGNSAGGYGGGIDNTGYTDMADATIINSTVSGNSTGTGGTGTGGGLFLYFGSLRLGNSVVAGNTAQNGKEIMKFNGTGLISQGHNLFGENGSSGLVNANPIASDKIMSGAIATAIGPLANNGGPTQTHLPVAGSVMINVGNNSLIPVGVTTDQRGAGFPRIVGGTVDIGAVEGTGASGGNDIVSLQASSPAVIGAGSGDDIYILNPSLLTSARTFTLTDTQGNNVIQLAAGLQIASSALTSNALRLTLTNGAHIDVYGANGFSYAACGNAAAGLNPTPVSFATFATATLGVAVPANATTIGNGGAKTITCP